MLQEVSIPRLAELTGVNERTLYAYRKGTRRPPPEKVLTIAGGLGRMLEDS